MKIIATIFLVVFTFFQVAPSVSNLFTDSPVHMIVDEEKGGEKPEIEKKEKKEYSPVSILSSGFSHRIKTAFQLAEKIHPSPYPEKVTPPPNFC